MWFAVNFLFGATDIMPGVSAAIAWQAHVGGFLVGLLLFPLFDIPKSRWITEPPEPRFDYQIGAIFDPREPGAGDDEGQNKGSS